MKTYMLRIRFLRRAVSDTLRSYGEWEWICSGLSLGVDLLRFVAESLRTTLKQCMNCTCELPREKPPYQRKKEMDFILA